MVSPQRDAALPGPLPEGCPQTRHAALLVYETGANQWHRYDAWPRSCGTGCPESSRNLYLQPGGGLAFDVPAAGIAAKYDEYISDPAKPVPYRHRPTLSSEAPDSTWGEWLVDDQRNAASRPDVLVYETEPLQEPVRVAGEPIAHLFASTSGTRCRLGREDHRCVAGRGAPIIRRLGGYQQMLSADILRGRYRDDPANPHAIEPNKVLTYRLPPAERQPHVPAGPPHHGADPVELVSALRPQPADVTCRTSCSRSRRTTSRRRSACGTRRKERQLHRAAGDRRG